MVSRSETITSGSLMSLEQSQPSCSMLPDSEGSKHMPTATAKGVDNYKSPNVSRETEEKPPLKAWKRLQWLLNTFQTNGQKCDAHTAIEATFRGDDLYYSSHVQPQPTAMSSFTQQPMTAPCPCCSVIKHTKNFY